MTKQEYEKNKEQMAPFKCGNGRTYMAFKTSCLFCKHGELFWDYTNGPYMSLCQAEGKPEDDGTAGTCELFEQEG